MQLPQLNTDPIDIVSPMMRGAQMGRMQQQNKLAQIAMQRDEEARQAMGPALHGDEGALQRLMQADPDRAMQAMQYQQMRGQKQLQIDQKTAEEASRMLWYITQAPEQKQPVLWKDFLESHLSRTKPELYEALKGHPWDKDTALMWMAKNLPTESLQKIIQGEKFGEAKSYTDAAGNPIVGQVGESGTFRQIPGVSPYQEKAKEEWSAPGEYFDLAQNKMVVSQIDKGTGKRRDITGLAPKPGDDAKTQEKYFEQEKKLRDEFEKASKTFVTVRDAYSKMKANEANASPYGSMALIFGLMKLYDPESVVRETEYATAQNAAGVPDKIRNMWNKALSGDPINADQRVDILRTAESIYGAQQQNYSRTRDQFRRLSEGYGLNPENVTGKGGDYISIPGIGQSTSKPPSDMSDQELLQELQKIGLPQGGGGQSQIRKSIPMTGGR